MLVADIHRYKDSAYAMSPEKVKELSAASAPFVQKYASLGKWKKEYLFANGRGGIAIWEFASGEEMSRILRESPVWGYLDSEIIVLSENDMIGNALKEAAKTTKKTARK